MAQPATCTHCGEQLAPGASACASCGGLTATQAGSCLDIIAGVIGGLFLGTACGLAVAYLANLQFIPGCATGMPKSAYATVNPFTWGAMLGIAGVIAAVGVLVYGIRSVQTGRPRLGATVLVGAVAFLVPAAPCTVMAITDAWCR